MNPDDVGRAVETVAHELVRLQHLNGSSFVNLPMLYPDGSSVTVKIDSTPGGLRVSDNGFAYREAEDVGATRSFGQNKKNITEEFGVQIGARRIFLDTAPDGLFEAICDVASASWQLATRAHSSVPNDEEELELEEDLNTRLKTLFYADSVEEKKELAGASSVTWPVSALVSFKDHKTVFQAVGEHPNSINRSSTAFRDLSLLRRPPRLVAVVNSIQALGPKLALLTQARAKVIERKQADDIWKAAA